jgi:cytochrome c553
MHNRHRGVAGHAFAWGSTAVVYWLVVAPVLEMAALDFELVVVNQFELDAASLDAIPWGRAFVRWGPVPLLLAGVLHSVYRLQRPWTSVSGPLALPSPRSRIAVGLVLGLPFAIAIGPLSIAMAVLVAVEVYSWVEWHLKVDPAVEWAFAIVPAVAVPCLVWGAWRTLRSFRDKPIRVPPARGPVQVTLRLAASLPGVVLLVASIGLAVATVPQAARVVGTDGGAAFARQCGTCHFRTAPLSYSKTPFEWGLTVERMRTKIPGVITDEDAAQIHEFLTNVRATSDESAFRSRCARCHGSTWRRWERRPRDEWQGLVNRIARWSPDYYRQPVAAQIVDQLQATLGDEASTLGLSAMTWEHWQRVGEVCQTCHSIGWNRDLYRDREPAAARAMVARMSQKMIEPLDEQEIDDIATWWLELTNDDREFRRVFPHDRPEPEPESRRTYEERTPRGGGY